MRVARHFERSPVKFSHAGIVVDEMTFGVNMHDTLFLEKVFSRSHKETGILNIVGHRHSSDKRKDKSRSRYLEILFESREYHFVRMERESIERRVE